VVGYLAADQVVAVAFCRYERDSAWVSNSGYTHDPQRNPVAG
jgi:hypothetical protein